LRLRLPRVTAVHDLSFFSLPDDFTFGEALRRRLLLRASLPASSALLACSSFTRREIVGRFPETASRVFEVPLGPDLTLPPAPSRESARARLGIEGPLLLSVGSIFNRRHPLELLRAVKNLVPSHHRLL
jgi:hypothetical protein